MSVNKFFTPNRLKKLTAQLSLILIMTLLASLFIKPLWIRGLAGSISAVILFKAAEGFLSYRAERICREQTELLLQFLCTETSSGHSLDSAFISAPLHFEKLYSKSNSFQNGLAEISAGLRLQIPLHSLISDFCSGLCSQEARIVLHVLTTIDYGGSDLPEVLHQQSRILGDMKRIERQVAAENAQQSTEAFILCLLPFIAMFLLRTAAADYMEDSFQSWIGQLMLGLSFLMSSAALICNLHFRSYSSVTVKDESLVNLKRQLVRLPFLANLSAKIMSCLPRAYILKIYSAMRILWTLRSSQEENAEYERNQAGITELNTWFQLKVLWFLIGIPLTALATLLGLPLAYSLILVILLPFVQDHELLSRASRYQNELMQALPLFISTMNQLIKSGMVVRRALLFTIQQMPEDSALHKELLLLENSLLGGLNAAVVLGEFSARLDIPEAQSALLLLARQETHGGAEMLRQLDQASQDCWSILGTAYRRKKEIESQRMFIPMLLDMFAVIIMGAAPALLMFIQ